MLPWCMKTGLRGCSVVAVVKVLENVVDIHALDKIGKLGLGLRLGNELI